jgi:hypothetical protein
MSRWSSPTGSCGTTRAPAPATAPRWRARTTPGGRACTWSGRNFYSRFLPEARAVAGEQAAELVDPVLDAGGHHAWLAEPQQANSDPRLDMPPAPEAPPARNPPAAAVQLAPAAVAVAGDAAPITHLRQIRTKPPQGDPTDAAGRRLANDQARGASIHYPPCLVRAGRGRRRRHRVHVLSAGVRHYTSSNEFCTTCHSMTYAEDSYQAIGALQLRRPACARPAGTAMSPRADHGHL